LLEVLLLTHFDALLTGNTTGELQTDVRFHSPFGHVHAAMFNGIPWIRFFTSPKFKGPYADAVQELLSELGGER
jgi:predicted HTH transcriptional regulator